MDDKANTFENLVHSNGDPETSPKRELVRSKSLTNITNTLSQQQTVEQEELKSDNSGPNTLHSQQLSNQLSPEKINEFKEAFDSFDDEGKGKLSKAQFRKFVESANCEDLTDEQFDTIFSHFEADNEECISFEKFLNGVEKWMKVVVNGNEKPSTLTTSKRDYLHSLLSPRLDSLRRTTSFHGKIHSRSETNSPIKPLARRLELSQSSIPHSIDIVDTNFHRKLTESLFEQKNSSNPKSDASNNQPQDMSSSQFTPIETTETQSQSNINTTTTTTTTVNNEPKVIISDSTSSQNLSTDSIPATTNLPKNSSLNLSLPLSSLSSTSLGSRLLEEKRVSTPRNLKTQFNEEMKKIFGLLDEDKDGNISFHDVKNYMLKTNMSFDETLAANTFDDYDSEKSGKLSFNAFTSFWMELTQHSSTPSDSKTVLENTSTIQELQHKIDQLETRKLFLEEALKSASSQNYDYQQEIQTLKSKLNEYEKTRGTQSNDTKNLQDKLESLKEDLEKQKIVIDNLTKKKKDLEVENQKLKEMLETNTKQISDLQQDKEAIEQKLNNKIKLKIPNLKKKCDLQQKQIETLQRELDVMRESYEKEKSSTFEKTKTIEKLEKELAEAQKEIIRQKQPNNKLQEDITQLETEIKQLNSDKKQLSEENRQLRLQLKQIEESLSQTYSNTNWQEEKSHLIEETKKLQEQISFTQQEKEKYAISLSDKEQDLQKIKQILSEKENTLQKLQNDLMEIQRDREEKESQIKVLKKEKDECQSQLAKMEQQIEELQKVNARLKEENNEIQTKFKKLQETLAKEHQINQQNNQNLHDEFNTQKQKIEEELKKTLSQMTTISSQLQTAIAQNEKLSKELEVLVKEKIELSQKYQETENKVKQLEAQNKHLSSVLQQRPSLLLLQRNASDTPGITIFQQILMIALLATIIVLCSLIIPSRFFSRHLRAT